jgi:acetyl esterase/lipase
MTPALRIASFATAAVVALLALAACAPLATLNALSANRDSVRTEGVAYGALARQRLDVFRPAAAVPARGWPVVVFFYGGSWNRGERADYRFVGGALAARGVLTLVADYRLYPEVRYPEFLKDSAAALAYGLDHAAALGGDPKRVFVMGHSAGGYNAAMLALDARWLQPLGHAPAELAGWIGLAGAYDFLPMTNPDARPVFFHPDYPPHTQPIEYVDAKSPPTFLAAPANDALIDPERNSAGLHERLRQAGVPVVLKRYQRVGHATLVATLAAPLRFLAPTLEDVIAFIESTPARR